MLMMQTLLKQRVKTLNDDNKSLTRQNITAAMHNFNFKIVTLMLYIVITLMLYIDNLLLYVYIIVY